MEIFILQVDSDQIYEYINKEYLQFDMLFQQMAFCCVYTTCLQTPTALYRNITFVLGQFYVILH